MKPDPLEEGRRWLAQAKDDITVSEHLLRGGFHNYACFFAQQAAEKALKAYLLAQGAREVRGHSVGDLCLDAARLDPAFEGLADEVTPLDKYYIPTRYPNGLPGGTPSRAFDRVDSERALALARHAVAFVEERL
ncbi:MAG TPA: DNA-binding protein [Clostridiales bacterium]|nr:DNA-binding protein [Clostridiales bacterium]